MGMTNRENELTINKLKDILAKFEKDEHLGIVSQNIELNEYDYWAIDMAIKALEQELTTKNNLGVDAISREETLKIMRVNHFIHDGEWAMRLSMDEIRDLPSITPQEPRWISVSERLPEDYEDVLVSGEDIVKQAQFIKGIFECEDDGVYALLSDEKMIDAEFTFKALAWQPLPKPYEPQESENDKNVLVGCIGCKYSGVPKHAVCNSCINMNRYEQEVVEDRND